LTQSVWRLSSTPARAGIGCASLRGVLTTSGSEACVDPAELAFPFSQEDWDEAIRYVEAEAERLWDEANEEEADDE
jgi:hypothetical protein